MTSTESLPGLSGTTGGEGLIKRRFTKKGQTFKDVFDTVEWDKRDALIENHKEPGAKPTFKQPGVEFPASWSQNSTNITSQKYFRGQLDSPSRENSVRQMITRVASTITS